MDAPGTPSGDGDPGRPVPPSHGGGGGGLMPRPNGSAHRIWTIARRELKALFDHPTGYVLLIVWVAVNSFLFFRLAYLVGVASLRPMLDLLPWVFLFFVPAVTMRAISDDARTGVLEVVLT